MNKCELEIFYADGTTKKVVESRLVRKVVVHPPLEYKILDYVKQQLDAYISNKLDMQPSIVAKHNGFILYVPMPPSNNEWTREVFYLLDRLVAGNIPAYNDLESDMLHKYPERWWWFHEDDADAGCFSIRFTNNDIPF